MRNPRLNLLSLLLFCLCPFSSAQAATAAKPVWDYWYTMTVNGKIHYGYYNERVELMKKSGKIRFQNNLWKKEEGFINEEQMGTVAANDAQLTPLFFNFHSVYRTTETTIDGNVNGRLLTAKIRQGGKELPLVKRTEPEGVIFSQFFPVWLGLKLPTMKDSETLRFQAIIEDNVDGGFAPAKGSVKLEKPDAFATRTQTRKLSVDFREMNSLWWVDRNGAAVRIEMPAQKVLVERVPEEKAKRFLTSGESGE